MRSIVFLFLCLTTLAQAQERAPKPPRPPFTIKVMPLGLLNPVQQSLMFHADIPLARHFGIEMGVGPVLNSAVYASLKGEEYKGYRVRPALRYYFDNRSGGYSYLALASKFYHIDSKEFVQVLRQGAQYTEWMLRRIVTDTKGVSLQAGAQLYLGARKRFLIEPFIGAGWRWTNVKWSELPPDAELQEEFRLFQIRRQPGEYSVFDVMAGVRVGWVLGRIR